MSQDFDVTINGVKYRYTYDSKHDLVEVRVGFKTRAGLARGSGHENYARLLILELLRESR